MLQCLVETCRLIDSDASAMRCFTWLGLGLGLEVGLGLALGFACQP